MKVVIKTIGFVVKHRQLIGLIVGSSLVLLGYDVGNEVIRASNGDL